MPVTLQNIKRGSTVFSIPGERQHRYTWKGHGDPSGGDILEVPDDIAKDVNIRKMISRGILVEVDAEVAFAAVEQQMRAKAQQVQQAQQDVMQSMDPAINHDIVSVPCQGPNSRGNGDCGVLVAVKESNVGQAPALCPQHSVLANQFVEFDTGETKIVGDHPEAIKKWVRPTIGPSNT